VITPPTILVVEDERLVLAVIEDELLDSGFHVLRATSGFEALAVINTRPHVSALLTDIMLGSGPDGWSVAEAFREVYPLAPVIYVSGYVPGATRKVPGGAFFDKPYRPAVIIATLKALLCLDPCEAYR
jgi:CheY-like chemotaxis protein